MNDMYTSGPRAGEPKSIRHTEPRPYWDLRNHRGPDPKYADTCGEPDEPMVGNIRAQLITDPDAHQTSFQHFSLTGENWIGTTCYPDGADIQGGDL